MKGDLPIQRPPEEELLYGVWARRGFDPRKLRTVDGARTQVVFPGRRNGGAGPDFLDASVDVEGRGLLRGDVEIHVRARDWMSHGHHRDPAYNGVVLHVVWEADSLWTEREDGQHVPTVPLRGCLQTSVEADSGNGVTGNPPLGGCDEIASALGAEQVARLLDEAGDERFATKASPFPGGDGRLAAVGGPLPGHDAGPGLQQEPGALSSPGPAAPVVHGWKPWPHQRRRRSDPGP